VKYKVTLTTLTPLHIGTGAELLKEFDFHCEGATTFILDQDAIYARELERNGAQARWDKPAATLVTLNDLKPGSPFVRYTLRGSTTVAQIREQIKDVHGQCYLPGSSLKGALRTAFLRYAVEAGLFQPDSMLWDNRAKFADDKWEREVFGDNPNRDIMRALQVADSAPLPIDPSPLELGTVRVFVNARDAQRTDSEIPLAVEAVQAGVTFEATLTFDELALRYADVPEQADKLDWQNRRTWLAHLPEMAQQAGRRHLNEELDMARNKGFAAAEAFYQGQLAGDETAIVLQMSWGTGWNGMTVGEHLPQAMHDEARTKYKLGQPPQERNEAWLTDLSKPFPKTRRLVNGDSMLGLPLGWVKLILEPLESPGPLWQRLTQSPLKPMTVTATPRAYATSPQRPGRLAASAIPASAPVAPPPPRPAPLPKAPLTESFTAVPKVGDRFKGKVFDQAGRALSLFIPGLDDTVAYAYIAPEDNDTSKKYEEGDPQVCEVIGLKQRGKVWEVRCRKG